MSDIQKAREVLAKWRDAARNGEWSIEADTAESSWLGRGTAGNPELLDAIDRTLDASASSTELSSFDSWGKRIAAAIIAADERMRS